MRTIWKVIGGLAATTVIIRFFTKFSSANAISVPVFVYGWTADKPFTDMTKAFSAGNGGGSMKLHAPVEVGAIILLVNILTSDEKQCRVVNISHGGRANVIFLPDSQGSFWTQNAEVDKDPVTHSSA